MFLKLGPKSRDIPVAALVPNFVTTLALCSGLASLHFILSGKFEHAMLAIVAAGIFDVLDGGAARLLRVTSKFGAVLDSLSDFLAFGVAPAMLLHQWLLIEQTTRLIDTLGLVAVMVFAVCAALRLARFTSAIVPAPVAVPVSAGPVAASKARPSMFFVGMPTPAGAGVVLVPAFLKASGHFPVALPEWGIALYTLVVAVLMVSRLPMFALKGARISRRAVAPLLVVLVVVIVLMLQQPWLTFAGLGAAYLLTIPVSIQLHNRQRARLAPLLPTS